MNEMAVCVLVGCWGGLKIWCLWSKNVGFLPWLQMIHTLHVHKNKHTHTHNMHTPMQEVISVANASPLCQCGVISIPVILAIWDTDWTSDQKQTGHNYQGHTNTQTQRALLLFTHFKKQPDAPKNYENNFLCLFIQWSILTLKQTCISKGQRHCCQYCPCQVRAGQYWQDWNITVCSAKHLNIDT